MESKAGVSVPTLTESAPSEPTFWLADVSLTWSSLHVSYVMVYVLVPSSKDTSHVGLVLPRVPNVEIQHRWKVSLVSVTPFSLGTRFSVLIGSH